MSDKQKKYSSKQNLKFNFDYDLYGLLITNQNQHLAFRNVQHTYIYVAINEVKLKSGKD